MKKYLIVFLTVCLLACALTGCLTKEEQLSIEIAALEAQVAELKTEVSALTAERDTLKNEVTDIKVENGTAKYIITFNIKQSHFTLDIGQHLKDEMNELSIQIPVDKEYYDSVNVGDTIADDFRVGSFIFAGSFGNWDITVEDKSIQ